MLLSFIQSPLDGDIPASSLGSSSDSVSFIPGGHSCFSLVLCTSGQLVLSSHLSRGEDRCRPKGWHRTLLHPLWLLLIPQVIAAHSPNVPTLSTGLSWGPCFPETSKLVSSSFDLKAPFCISWVGLWFQSYFWPGIKDCPSVQEFQAWMSRWMRYFGGQRVCLCAPETTPPSASVQETPPIPEKMRAHFLL